MFSAPKSKVREVGEGIFIIAYGRESYCTRPVHAAKAPCPERCDLLFLNWNFHDGPAAFALNVAVRQSPVEMADRGKRKKSVF